MSVAYAWTSRLPRNPSLVRRAWALLIDLLIVSLVSYALTLALTAANIILVPAVPVNGQGNELVGFLWIVSLVELPLNLLYFTLAEGLTGRTLGKMLLGLRVREKEREGLGMMSAFLRNLLRLLWVTPVGIAFVVLDVYIVHATELDQRIGDLAAGTIVVEDSS